MHQQFVSIAKDYDQFKIETDHLTPDALVQKIAHARESDALRYIFEDTWSGLKQT